MPQANLDILFDCPHCGGPLVVEQSGRGASCECPHCAETITIPSAANASLPLTDAIKEVDLMALRLPDARPGKARVLKRVRVAQDVLGAAEAPTAPRRETTLRPGFRPEGRSPEEQLIYLENENVALHEELAARRKEVQEWKAYHEAVQNDLEQANELANDFKAQLAEKVNELGTVRLHLQQMQRDTSAQQSELAKVGTESDRLRKAVEMVTRQLDESVRELKKERRQNEVEVARLKGQIESMQMQRAEGKPIRPGASPAAETPSPELVNALRQLEASLVAVRKLIPGKAIDSNLDIVFAA